MKNIFKEVSIEKGFLLIMLILLIVLLGKFFSSFFGTLLIAGMTVSVVSPIYKLFNEKWKLNRTISALITMLLTVILFVVPLTFFMFAVVEQASQAYSLIMKSIGDVWQGEYDFFSYLDRFPKLSALVQSVLDKNPISFENIAIYAGDAVGVISKFLIENTTNILRHFSVVIIHLIVFLLGIFYFLKDGETLIKFIKSIIPLSKKHKTDMFEKIKQLMHSVVFGMFGAAIVQGIALGIGFSIVGVPNAIFWAALAALFSPVPYVGASLVWLPVGLSMMVSGSFWAGLFIMIWGGGIVSSIDNLIKPYIIGAGTMLNPFALMIVIFGGIFSFGLKGIIFGPFVLLLTLTFLDIYKQEYKSILDPKGVEEDLVPIIKEKK